MIHPYSPQLQDNQDITDPKYPDKRETVKSPVNPLDFSALIKQARSGSLHLEQAYGGPHRDDT